MRYEREISAGSRTQAQRMRGRRRKSGRVIAMCGIAAWFFIALNLFLLTRMQTRLRDMRDLLNTTYSRLVLVQQELEMRGSGSIQGSLQQAGNAMSSGAGSVLEGSYASLWGMEKVETPKVRSKEEILRRLKSLGADNSTIMEIYENRASYPDKLLEALANNPEMAGFVSGYMGMETKARAGLTKEEKEAEYPLFLQWDPRWGYVEYGKDGCIALAGCGPTCLAMAMFYLTGNEDFTPDAMAAYSMKKGHYVVGAGTAWTLFTELPPLYGVGVDEPGIAERELKRALDGEKVLICSMQAGDFTVGGHFVVVYGYDEDGFLINDPNCVARSTRHWTWDEIGDQIKHVWSLGRSGTTAVTYTSGTAQP